MAPSDPRNKATCTFDNALVVTKESAGPYRCPGPRRLHTDFTVEVTTRLHTAGSCAAVWFRFDKISVDVDREAGYVLRICADGYTLMTHGAATDASKMVELTSFPFAEAPSSGQPIRVGISADGSDLSFRRDDLQIGTWRDAQFTKGRVVLGVVKQPNRQSPARVSFNDVEIRA
jgi:hypothetical protein